MYSILFVPRADEEWDEAFADVVGEREEERRRDERKERGR
jgi:hypothetical protein